MWQPAVGTIASIMAISGSSPPFTPLQRVIYETDLLGLNLRDSMRIATQRLGFFVGQQRYMDERRKIAALIAQYGPPEAATNDELGEATHQIGSP